MNKKLSPLEALYKVKDLLFCEMDEENYEEETNIIEAALKEYELMKDIRITARFDLAQVNKEHKALEIIKDKEVNVEIFNSCPNLYEYNNWATQLTQEEFDLLREVLQ